MPLVFDKKGDYPGAHALIVGVSRYPYLPGGDEPPTDRGFGLQSLTAAASSAFALYEWLTERARLPVPLASVRLMIAPSEEEVAKQPRLRELASQCAVGDFVAEASDWRRSARENEQGMTLFYFAGNGMRRSTEDATLLFSGFGSPDGRLLRDGVSLSSIYNGMAPTDPSSRKIALRQFYFIDTSRRMLLASEEIGRLYPTEVFDAYPQGLDNRSAAIFHAAAPGGQAFARPGKRSLFVDALLKGLGGGAGEELKHSDSSDARWGVTVQSLARYLSAEGRELSQHVHADMDFVISGQIRGDTVINELDGPPHATITIDVGGNLEAGSSVIILGPDGDTLFAVQGPRPAPISAEIPAGTYIAQLSGARTARRFFSAQPPQTTVVLGSTKS